MNIILIGFMGAGKSSVARELALLLAQPVIDVDSHIVDLSAYPSVRDIFQQRGEAYFRDLETQACRRCARSDRLIIATGGGVVERPENLEILRQSRAVVVYLQVSFDTLCQRVGQDPSRPLFADIQQARRLYQRRLPLYEQAADLILPADTGSVSALAQQIAAWVEQQSAPHTDLSARSEEIKHPVSPVSVEGLVSARTQVCMIWGDPVAHSLSPAMHNAAYRALGLEHRYIFVAARVTTAQLYAAVQGAKAMGFRGITCTIPHKEAILPYLDEIDSMAARIGAVNTVVQQDGRWTGYNTDWLGVVQALTQYTSLRHKRVAILGAGGTAKAAAFGVLEHGASDVWIFNRTSERAVTLAKHVGGSGFGWDQLPQLADCDIVIQTTSVGMSPDVDQTPIPPACLQPHHVVLDAVYTPRYTRLLRDAQQVGAQIVPGTDMFLYQGMAQFSLYTGVTANEQTMRQVIEAFLPT